MKVYTFFIIAFLYSCSAFAGNLPLFELPENYNYHLFDYKPKDIVIKNARREILNDNIKIDNIQAKSLSKAIKGIFLTENGNWVLLDTIICTKGDIFDGYRIEEIKNDKVIFSKNGRKVVVNIEKTPSLIDNSSKR